MYTVIALQSKVFDEGIWVLLTYLNFIWNSNFNKLLVHRWDSKQNLREIFFIAFLYRKNFKENKNIWIAQSLFKVSNVIAAIHVQVS